MPRETRGSPVSCGERCRLGRKAQVSRSRVADGPVAEPGAAEGGQTVASTAPINDDAGIRVQVPGFEGPLDLLLHLIQEHELDILDIPIGFITERYLEYLELMQELNIDVASEYLVMAATLAHIKSRILLPSAPPDEEDAEGDELDPRAELIRRLLEYQKYKLAAAELSGRRVLGRDVFGRVAAPDEAAGLAPLASGSSFQLLEAFRRVLARAKTVVDHEIELDRLSINERINQLVDLLRPRGRMPFEELFSGQRTRPELIVTFLALLELTRLRMTRLYQESPLAPITVELAVCEEPVETPSPSDSQPTAPGSPVDGAVPASDESEARELDGQAAPNRTTEPV